MALKATVYKALLQVADLDRQVYGDFPLTLARHPSENEQRLMLRLLAFALNAHEQLTFTRGISSDDEPDLWRKDLTGAIEQWIEIGLPSAERVRKACARAQEVRVYAAGQQSLSVWCKRSAPELERFSNLQVFEVKIHDEAALLRLAERNMSLQCTVQEQQCWLGNGELSVQVDIELLFPRR